MSNPGDVWIPDDDHLRVLLEEAASTLTSILDTVGTIDEGMAQEHFARTSRSLSQRHLGNS